jgi:Protein of unknown function (DUF3239)
MFERHDASNPAWVRFDWRHFLKCDRRVLAFAVTLALAAGGLYFVKPLLSLVLLVAVVLTFFHSIRQAKGVFANGTVFAAQVIDAKRNLLAVFGDLSKVGRSVPAIKVIRQPLERLLGTRPRNGTRLAYVGIYNGVAGRSRWLNFNGWLVNAGTPDRRAVARVVQSIPSDDWEMLEKGIACLPTPYRPQLYAKLDFQSIPAPLPMSGEIPSEPADDPVTMVCPSCRARLRFRGGSLAGRTVACPKCKAPLDTSSVTPDPRRKYEHIWEKDDLPPLPRSAGRTKLVGGRWRQRSGPLNDWRVIAGGIVSVCLILARVGVQWEKNRRPAVPLQAAPNGAATRPEPVARDDEPQPKIAVPDLKPNASPTVAEAQPAAAPTKNEPFPAEPLAVAEPPRLGTIAQQIPRIHPPNDGALGPHDAQENPLPGHARRFGHRIPAGETLARRKGTISVEVRGKRLSSDQLKAIETRIRKIHEGEALTMQIESGPQGTMFRFNSKRDVFQFAVELGIAKVSRVDLANRRITLDGSTLQIDPQTATTSDTGESPFKVESPPNVASNKKNASSAKEESPFKVESKGKDAPASEEASPFKVEK